MGMKVIISVDPGASGGIVGTVEGCDTVLAYPMPKTEGGVLDCIRELAALSSGERVAIVEHVSGYAGAGQPGSAMYRFGFGTGFVTGVLMTLNFKIELVRPQKWTKFFSLGTHSACASRTEWKNKLKACAERLYPNIRVTLATADALLLLEYYRRQLL